MLLTCTQTNANMMHANGVSICVFNGISLLFSL